MDGIAFEDMRIGKTVPEAASVVKERATPWTACAVAGKIVIAGEATVMPRSRA